VLTTESAQALVTTGRRRCPCRGGPYLVLRRFPSPFSFLLPCYFCSTSLLAAALLHIVGHLCPPLSPTKPGTHIAITPSMCSSNREHESPANDVRKNRSLSHCLPLVAAPSTAVVRAHPSSSPCPAGPCESVVWPCIHLCRQRSPVRITSELSSAAEFLTIAP
jgi:hypothetical protein